MQLSNAKRIVIEDFPEDQRETVGKLATIINSFMEEVVDLSRGNIGYDNLQRSKVVLDITLDDNGKPKGVSQISANMSSVSGSIIINCQLIQGSGANVISSPYLDYTHRGNGVVTINKFHGLPLNKKLRVTIEFIP